MVTRDLLNPLQDADLIVQKLLDLLPLWATTFEYGAWKWRQSLFLAKNGVQVHIQDKNEDFLKIIETICIERNLSNITIEKPSEAQNHTLENDFDAFLCIRLLHFLEKQDAEKVIRNMQKHTKLGWYNVLQIFLEQTEHQAQYFFPDISEITGLYKWWYIISQTEVHKSDPSETTNGRIMYQMGIIFKKL